MRCQPLHLLLSFGCLMLLFAGPFTMPANSQPPADAGNELAASNGDDAATPEGTPVLGIVVADTPAGEHAEVLRVWPESPAEQAGLKAGDRLVKVGEKKTDTPAAVQQAILQHAPGDRITIEIDRGGEMKSLDVRLGGADGLFGWMRHGAPEAVQVSGWLGVQVAPGPSSRKRGVKVTGVLRGSPADAAGIQSDDVILRVDKTRVEAPADLKAAIASHRPGETVKIAVRRNGEQQSFDVELGSFTRWHGDLSRMPDIEARELLGDLLAAPFALADLAEELLPAQGAAKQKLKEQVHLPKLGVAQLMPTKGSDAHGTIVLRQKQEGLHLTGEVKGLTPGLHGFHIHEFGDARDPAGQSAGGHFDPRGAEHGGPGDQEHHAGDLGNIEANEEGVAKVDILAPWLKLHFVIGRSIVVHGGEDDLQTQPSGDAGPRVALGVVGIAEPASAKTAQGKQAAK